MSEAECNNADWALRGEDDGRLGYRRDRVNEHSKACAEFGVKPDLQAYSDGWAKGIRTFCTPAKGWQTGKEGSSYQNSCPPELETPFYEAYDLGAKIFAQQATVTSLEVALDEINADLNELLGDSEEKKKLKKKRKQLKRDLADGQAELFLLELDAQQRGFQ
ncbi:MAG: DUF2799 domain-containing protein [Pseudomonadota bacterium]